MPKIDFCFSGWITGAEINEVVIATGETIDVSNESAESVAEKLENGDYMIALGDYLYDNHRKDEIKIEDFEAHWEPTDPNTPVT